MDISGTGTLYSQNLTSQSGSSKAAALQNKLSSANSSDTDEKLMETCKEFEAYFMEQVFDAMLKTTKVFSDEENSYASKMVDYFKDSAVQELTSQATDRQGLGIANTLYEQMKRNYGL